MIPHSRTTPNRALAACSLVLTLGCLWLGACRSVGPSDELPLFSQRSDDRAFQGIRRVMVLPLRNAEGTSSDTESIRDSLTRSLVRIGDFEIRPLPTGAEEQDRIYKAAQRASLTPRDLVALGERYQIDAVVLGTVTAFRPYEPVRFGLRTRMLSLHDGSTLWQAEGVFDSKAAVVEEDVRRHYDRQQADEPSLHGWRMTLLSPQRFVDYSTSRIAGTLR